MVFASVEFLFLFLPLFLLFYVAVPWKNAVYVAFSLLFYFVGEGWFIAVIAASAVVNYACGLWIERSVAAGARRLATGVGVSANLLALFFFKYAGFFIGSLAPVSARVGWTTAIHLPLGISFFSFHAISYLVDIHRRDARAERSFLNLSLYLLMFPQLISGPILRFHAVARQLRRRVVTGRHVYFGIALFCIGLGQKVILADTLATICDPLFADWQSLGTAAAWLAAAAYSFQIYFDFGGYSNMAIGLGWITGFYFPRNFNNPYIARSITEFWQRWHMSLSRWFRDYLYIPLGGNRRGPARTYANLGTVFLLCGLWHGAAWTFVIWGAYHGAFLVIERAGLDRALRRCPRIVQHAYALVVIVFGWVLFRADSGAQAAGILSRMTIAFRADEVWAFDRLDGLQTVVLLLAALFSTPVVSRLLRRPELVAAMPPWPRTAPGWSYALGCAAALVLFVASSVRIMNGSYSPFIYFRF